MPSPLFSAEELSAWLATPGEYFVDQEVVQWPISDAPLISQSSPSVWSVQDDVDLSPLGDGNRTFLVVSPLTGGPLSSAGSVTSANHQSWAETSLALRRQRNELRISTWPMSGLPNKPPSTHQRSQSQPARGKALEDIRAANPPVPPNYSRVFSLPSPEHTVSVMMDMSILKDRPLPDLPSSASDRSNYSGTATLINSDDGVSPRCCKRRSICPQQRRARIFDRLPSELDSIALDSATIPSIEPPTIHRSRKSSLDDDMSPRTPTTPATMRFSKGSASMALIPTEPEDWNRPTYIPGPIRLSDAPDTKQLDFLPMTRYNAVPQPLAIPSARRRADETSMADELVDYFASFSATPIVDENGTEYWTFNFEEPEPSPYPFQQARHHEQTYPYLVPQHDVPRQHIHQSSPTSPSTTSSSSSSSSSPPPLTSSPPSIPYSPTPPPPPPKSPATFALRKQGAANSSNWARPATPASLIERRRSSRFRSQTPMHLNPTFLSTRRLVSSEEGGMFVF